MNRASDYTSYVETLVAELSPLGWDCGESPPLHFADAALRGVTLIARRRSIGLYLADLEPGSGIPDHHARRELYLRLARVAGESLVVVSDAAGALRIWMWVPRVGPFAGAYREVTEESQPGWRPETAGRAAAEMNEQGPLDPGERVREMLHHLLPRVAGSDACPGRPVAPEDVGERIACSRDVAETLACWRGLARLRLFDPDCGDGDWLLRGMEALEPLYAGCLQRMAGWLIDARVLGWRRHPALEVIRRAVEAAGGEGLPWAESHVRLLITLRNLRGVSTKPLHLAATRARLAHRLASGSTVPNAAVMPLLRHRVVRVASAVPPVEPTHSTRREGPGSEALLLLRAFETVGELHLGGRAPPDALARAYGELYRRRRRLAAPAGGTGDRGGPSELSLLFPELHARPEEVILP